jgi:putative effector of murein hydrolase LrgA (UPF0299 family)
MISTLTSSTITTVLNGALTGSLALIGILVLLILLVQKELAVSSSDARLQRLSHALNIAFIPLLVAFIVIAIMKVAEVLR